MKRPDGVTAISVWFIVDALLMLFMSCLLVAVPISGVIREINNPIGEFWAVFGLTCGVIYILVSGFLSALAAWGLLRLKQWARWLSFVLAIFTLFAFPIGTVIGALIIWYLLKQDVREVFELAEDGLLTTELTTPESE